MFLFPVVNNLRNGERISSDVEIGEFYWKLSTPTFFKTQTTLTWRLHMMSAAMPQTPYLRSGGM